MSSSKRRGLSVDIEQASGEFEKVRVKLERRAASVEFEKASDEFEETSVEFEKASGVCNV